MAASPTIPCPANRSNSSARVFDGAGLLVPDAVIEILQADSKGKYVKSREAAMESGFRGFGRFGTGTDPRNEFRFQTVKPGVDR